jgi:outer membrane protein assembly factor BamD (BamD/ComL family)
MRWALWLMVVALVACWATPAEAKFVFRDGKWIFVPDDEELPPRPAKTPTPTPQPDKPPVEVPEVPSPDPVTPGDEPQPVTPPEITSDPPPRLPPVIEPAAPSVPRVQPAPLDVAEVESVGLAYQTPEASQAADQVEAFIGRLPDTKGDAAGYLTEAAEAFRKGRYSRAVGRTKKLLKKFRHSQHAEGAQWLQAEARFSRGDYFKAFGDYETFVKTYAGSPWVDTALRREFQCAEALLGPARRKVLGVGILSGEDEAVAILEKVYGHRPTGPLAPDAVFRIAEYYVLKAKYTEAEEMLRKFLEEFPNHGRARQAELWCAKCCMAGNLGSRYDDSGLKRAQDTLSTYRRKYPKMAAHENVDGALERIRHLRAERQVERAEYYNRADRPKAARYYAHLVLTRYPATPAAEKARNLLTQLGTGP